MQWVSTACLTTAELAAYLRASRRHVLQLQRKGVIPAYRIGSGWRFNLAEVVEALQRRAAEARARGGGVAT